MGKRVTVKTGASYVPLPQANNPNKPFQAGGTADLTDAEYAALPASVTRFLNAPTNIPEPSRASKDANAKTSNVVSGATGAVALKSGINVLNATGNLAPTFPTGATVGSALYCDLVVVQDATGSRTLTLPASAKKAGAAAVTLTTTASAVDYLQFLTVDGGVTWMLINKQLDIR